MASLLARVIRLCGSITIIIFVLLKCLIMGQTRKPPVADLTCLWLRGFPDLSQCLASNTKGTIVLLWRPGMTPMAVDAA